MESIHLVKLELSNSGENWQEIGQTVSGSVAIHEPNMDNLPQWFVSPTQQGLLNLVCKEILGRGPGEKDFELFTIVTNGDLVGLAYGTDIVGQIVTYSDHYAFYPSDNFKA